MASGSPQDPKDPAEVLAQELKEAPPEPPLQDCGD